MAAWPHSRRNIDGRDTTTETEAGLNYLREQRERMTDQELIELYKKIKEIEHDAKEPWHKGYRFRLPDWRTHAKVP